ncbi:MAG: hypothetical protein PHY47_00710 [Lachnospiraceae bacterium]|nr:hypothetical protein [Lachnospiraceae bacterium]
MTTKKETPKIRHRVISSGVAEMVTPIIGVNAAMQLIGFTSALGTPLEIFFHYFGYFGLLASTFFILRALYVYTVNGVGAPVDNLSYV